MSPDLDKFAALADLCRAKGVREAEMLNDGGLRIRLVLGPLDAPPSKDAAKPDDETCQCGHALHDHGPLCLHGCDVDKCAKVAA